MARQVFLAATLLIGVGSGCGGEVDVDAAQRAAEAALAVPFRVSLKDGALLIEATEPVEQQTCTNELAVLTWSGASGWQPIRDERPAAQHHYGFYLDGQYVRSRCNGLYCDVVSCGPFRKQSLDAREYIADGTRIAPSDGAYYACLGVEVEGEREVPSIVSRPARARLAARILYLPDGCGSSALREVIVEAH